MFRRNFIKATAVSIALAASGFASLFAVIDCARMATGKLSRE